MRVFVAGASGVIGKRIVRLLVAAGADVAAMTRSPEKAAALRELGAEPVVCDVYDAEALAQAVTEFAPDTVVHQLTDLPDDLDRIGEFGGRERPDPARGDTQPRGGGTAGRRHPLRCAERLAWVIPGDGGAAVRELENAVMGIGGIVLRYGHFDGSQTYYEDTLPPSPRVHVDEAAERTVAALMAGGARHRDDRREREPARRVVRDCCHPPIRGDEVS